MKSWLFMCSLIALFLPLVTHAKPKVKTEGPVVELPTFVVIGTRIPSSWLEVAYECKGPLPIDRIKKAWISKVGHGTPAEAAGLKVGDVLLSFDGHPTESMTGFSLHDSLQQERSSGTHLEMVVQTKGTEKRTVAIVFN